MIIHSTKINQSLKSIPHKIRAKASHDHRELYTSKFIQRRSPRSFNSNNLIRANPIQKLYSKNDTHVDTWKPLEQCQRQIFWRIVIYERVVNCAERFNASKENAYLIEENDNSFRSNSNVMKLADSLSLIHDFRRL